MYKACSRSTLSALLRYSNPCSNSFTSVER